ncbi:MAG TPA: hypothetical protein VGN26_10310 [Armatimonadota bacterium]|jgi:hypothetical protein
MATVASSSDRYLESVKRLVEQHRDLKDEPLVLAVYFRKDGEPHVLEVVQGFGLDQVNEDGELFRVAFGTSRAFPLYENDSLHLILTNPKEIQVAINEGWADLGDVLSAIRVGAATDVFDDGSEDARRIWKALYG